MLTSVLLILALDGGKPPGFRADVAPILVAKCLGCHNPARPAGGLDISTLARLRKGGKRVGAEMIVAGEPDESHLVEVLRPDAMPRMPYKQPPLSAAEVAIVEGWIEQGAKSDGPSETSPIASMVDPIANAPKVAARVPTSPPLTALAFGRDGSMVAAASGRSVLLLDARSGDVIATLGDHPGPVNALAVTPDGSTLIASGGRAGQFGSVVVWDLATRARVREIRAHADAILAADLAPDGRTLATASYDRTVRLWDVASGRELRTLREHTDAVHAVGFSPDGRLVASGGADRTVKVWDVADGTRRVSLGDSSGEVYAVAFGRDGSTLYAGGADRSIRAWSLGAGGAAPLRSITAHEGAILRLRVGPAGKTLASSGEDRAVRTWTLPGLEPIAGAGPQPDWPQSLAFSPDGTRLAVGRYDGSIAVLDPSDGRPILALRGAPGPPPSVPRPKPSLVRPATLDPPSPRGATRGTTVRLKLSGLGVGRASAISFDDPGLVPIILAADKPGPDRLEVDLAISPETRPGVHQLSVRTPLGVPKSRPFVVSADPEVREAEPDDDRSRATPAKLPATLVGTIDRPGDVDAWRFDARRGRTVVFEVTAAGMGSTLSPALSLVDARGRTIASAGAFPPGEAALVARIEADGPMTLIVSDLQHGGGADHGYRVDAGERPRVATLFPVGVGRGSEAPARLEGVNIHDGCVRLDGRGREPGTIVPVPYEGPGGVARASRSYVVAEGPQGVEAEPNDAPGRANPVASPGGISGRIGPGDVDLFRFEARKGRRVIVEAFGRRLGSPIDPAVEILDDRGRPVPRAVLRPVAETTIAFRDHPSTTRSIRLTRWDGLAMGDYLLGGRELLRLAALPRNPDDDAVFWGLGGERADRGERLGFLETTPEQHPQGQPLYRVEIHPPGTTFPGGGLRPVTLSHRNDDGGPGLGKDARVTFDPPADGTYLARVEDVRGLGGDDFTYQLVVRPARPDFAASLGTDDPEVPRGGAAVVRVDLARLDGFDGAVDVALEGLPPGISATTARVEPGAYAADLLLRADASAPPTSAAGWRLVARSSGEPSIRHEGPPALGRITVTPEPDLRVSASTDRVAIAPGERVQVTLRVDRGPAFAGRVPIDVRNLPAGVRVLNIGLNGVLVTESEASRPIFLYAEPWVAATERPFYAVGRVEAAGTESSSPPISLLVRPRSAAPGRARP